MDERLTVVPERASEDGRPLDAVIVTDNGGHRFRVLEAGPKVILEEDACPREASAAWIRVECAQATLRSTLAAILDRMKD